MSPVFEVKEEFRLKMDGPNIGPVVGVAFGCAWGVAGATALPRPWQAWAIGSSIGISGVLIVALALPHKQRHSGTFRGHIYGIAVVFEVAAIFGTIWLLRQFALSQFLLPAIGFIVGLHFLGLWKATDLRVFLWTALAMCLVCGVAAFLPGATENGNVDVRRDWTGHRASALGSRRQDFGLIDSHECCTRKRSGKFRIADNSVLFVGATNLIPPVSTSSLAAGRHNRKNQLDR